MKISVVIPAHNEEKYIAQTLEAILKQNHPDFEVIVVCNACTDKTEEIAKAFPVKVFKEDKPGGQRAREKGRSEASGEIIATLDADCLPDQDWLKEGQKYFNDSKVVAVTGPYDFYDSSPLFRSLSLIIQKYIYRYANEFLSYFQIGAELIGGNSIMRASALAKIGGFNTSILFYGDDTDTAKRLAVLGKIVFSKTLVMKSSARRFKKNGIMKTLFFYLFHFLKITFSQTKKKNI